MKNINNTIQNDLLNPNIREALHDFKGYLIRDQEREDNYFNNKLSSGLHLGSLFFYLGIFTASFLEYKNYIPKITKQEMFMAVSSAVVCSLGSVVADHIKPKKK